MHIKSTINFIRLIWTCVESFFTLFKGISLHRFGLQNKQKGKVVWYRRSVAINQSSQEKIRNRRGRMKQQLLR